LSLSWCRLYGEMVDDAKLKLLAFEDRWHYVAVLCCKTQGVLDTTKPELLDRIVAAKLGLAAREADEVRRRLIDVDLIDARWQPLAWDRRQFKSDDVSARVAKHRQKLSTASEEEPKTDTETDTEGKRSTERFRNVTATFHATLPMDAWEEWVAHRKARRWPCDPRTLGKQLSLLAKHDAAVQREMLDTSIQAGWQGLFAPKDGARKARPTRYEELMARVDAGATPALGEATQFLLGGKT